MDALTFTAFLIGIAGVGYFVVTLIAKHRKSRQSLKLEKSGPAFKPARQYAEENGLTLAQVANQIRRGRLIGRVIDGIWHVQLDTPEKVSAKLSSANRNVCCG